MSDAPVIPDPADSAGSPAERDRDRTPETPCPYLPGKLSRGEAYVADQLDGETYEFLLARGFRRSGRVVYRPRCEGCNECRQIRIPVENFHPTRSMRRIWQRSADMQVDVGDPTPTDEKLDLYRRYLLYQHDGEMSSSHEAFEEFLYNSPTTTLEFVYRLGACMVGVGIADRCPGGLSSVYMMFDPELAGRSLGTFSILWEIEYCRRNGLPYYYLGFYVARCASMSYKARFRPSELLAGEDLWVTFRE